MCFLHVFIISHICEIVAVRVVLFLVVRPMEKNISVGYFFSIKKLTLLCRKKNIYIQRKIQVRYGIKEEWTICRGKHFVRMISFIEHSVLRCIENCILYLISLIGLSLGFITHSVLKTGFNINK